MLLTNIRELESFEEGMAYEHRQKWIEAMQDKMKSSHDNKTFELISCQDAREH